MIREVRGSVYFACVFFCKRLRYVYDLDIERIFLARDLRVTLLHHFK